MAERGYVHEKGETYGKLPEKLMHDPTISDGAKILFAHMHWRYGRNKKNFEGRGSMAEMLDVSQVTITNRAQELEAADWIIVQNRGRDPKTGGFKTNFYHVFVDQEDCRAFRQEHDLPKPEHEVKGRKSRRGAGGRPAHGNSSSHGGDNSGLQGRENSSLHGGENSGLHYSRVNSSLHYPDSDRLSIDPDSDSFPATSPDVAGDENPPTDPSKPKHQKSAPTPPDDLFQADPGQYTKASLQAFYADAIAHSSLGNDPPDAPRLLAVWLDREREGRARAGVISWLERATREFWYEHHKAQWSYPDMTGLVAQACGLDLDDPNIVYIVRNLIAGPLWGIPNGYSPDELRAFLTYWQTDDWRGKKGQPCQTDQLAVELNKRRAARKRGKGKGAKDGGRAAAQGAALEPGTGDAGAGGPDTGGGLDDMPEVMAWFEQQQREQLEQIKRNLAGAAA